jgi:hypothetical protein
MTRRTATVDILDVLSALRMVALNTMLVGEGFVLQPLKTSRRRKDGDFTLRFVWRQQGADGVCKVTTTRRLSLALDGLVGKGFRKP